MLGFKLELDSMHSRSEVAETLRDIANLIEDNPEWNTSYIRPKHGQINGEWRFREFPDG